MEQAQIDKMIEALVLIEGLTINYFNCTFDLKLPDRKLLARSLKLREKINGEIYTIAHNATNHCEGCSTSDNMKQQTAKLVKRVKSGLKKGNTVDVDRVVKEIKEKLCVS